MPAHLETCLPQHDHKGPPRALVLLRFAAANDPRYWVYAEARADATLRGLDAFLRALWLDCCGHRSGFYAGQREHAMSVTVGQAFGASAAALRYEYDFGSTTELVGRMVNTRRGPGGQAAVRLLARNEAIAWRCADCAAPATVVCPFCIHGDDHLFCAVHADVHEHAAEEVYLPVVNSPRMGVCGYSG